MIILFWLIFLIEIGYMVINFKAFDLQNLVHFTNSLKKKNIAAQKEPLH